MDAQSSESVMEGDSLVDRAGRFNLLGRLPDGQDSTDVLAYLVEPLDRVPPELCTTLTWDRGTETPRWRDLEELRGIDV